MTALGHKIKVAQNEKQKIFQKHVKHFTGKFHQALNFQLPKSANAIS